MYHRAHVIRLMPTAVQQTAFARACGTARFAYNWGLEQWGKMYAAHQADPSLPKPSEFTIRKALNAVKRDEFPWMLEVSKYAPEEALRALGRGFANFFAGRARYPKFKQRGRHDAFRVDGQSVSTDGCHVVLPRIGQVRMREALRFPGRVLSATVSRHASGWFISLTVETETLRHRPAENQGTVGVDLGLAHLAVLSTGETIAAPQAYRRAEARLQRLQRALSRKARGSANRKKAIARVGRAHQRVADARADFLHKLTTDLARRFSTVVIEDLHVKGMAGGRLAKSVHDAGLGEFRRQLTYKIEARGGQLVVADRWFPSSKTCSACGRHYAGLKLGERRWTCTACGTEHDRDLNAAKNLLSLAAGAAVSACGEGSAGRDASRGETALCEAGR